MRVPAPAPSSSPTRRALRFVATVDTRSSAAHDLVVAIERRAGSHMSVGFVIAEGEVDGITQRPGRSARDVSLKDALCAVT